MKRIYASTGAQIYPFPNMFKKKSKMHTIHIIELEFIGCADHSYITPT